MEENFSQTPKRKRSPGIITPIKIPKFSFPTKITKTKVVTKQNPHPDRNQKLFIKIKDKMFLLKHSGLAKSSRKFRPKILAKITLSPNPRVTQLEPKINQNKRRISDNFQEKLKIFQQKETSSPAAPLTKSTSPTQTARKVKSTITPDLKPETREKMPEVMNLCHQTTHHNFFETKLEKLIKPEVMNPARPPPIFPHNFNPPRSHPDTSAADQSWSRSQNSKIQNSGGKFPPDQSDSRSNFTWARTQSDWTAPISRIKTQNQN